MASKNRAVASPVTKFADIIESVLGGDWGDGPDVLSPGFAVARVIRNTEFRDWSREKGKSAVLRSIKEPSVQKRQLRAGDLVIEVSGGGPKQPVGRSILIDEETISDKRHPLVYSNFLRRVRLKPGVCPAYVNLFLSFAHSSGELDQYQTQTTGLRNLDVGEFTERLLIPIIPLEDQRRIVARVEALMSRSQQLRDLNVSLVEDTTRLLRAEYKSITEEAPTKPFSDVAKLIRRWVKTKPDQNYPETGIRSFGKGTFHKPALTGEQLGTKRICRIKAGDLVFMNVFAWEGAIAVAQPEDDGRVASHRFMTHEVLPDQATAEFLCYYFLTERGLEQIRGASPGSAGRNRTLGITKLEKIPVPVPPIENQRRFAKLRQLHFQLQQLHREAEAELASFTPALLDKAFRGEI